MARRQNKLRRRSPSSNGRRSPAQDFGSNGHAHHLGLLSLFCGPGGMDEGFRQAGFRTELAYDIDSHSVAAFNRNHSPGLSSTTPIAFEADVRKLTAARVLKSAR